MSDDLHAHMISESQSEIERLKGVVKRLHVRLDKLAIAYYETSCRVDTYKEDQRVSAKAYNFLLTEYRRAYDLCRLLVVALEAEAAVLTHGEWLLINSVDGLMELPPPDPQPAAQLPADLPDSPDPGPDAASTGADALDSGNPYAEGGSGAD